jgi:HEAT repeat protein
LLGEKDAALPAARALADLGPAAAAAVPPLAAALKDPVGGSRDEIIDALGTLGPKSAPAVPLLIAELDRGSGWVLEWLAGGGEDCYIGAYFKVNGALQALGRIGPGAKEAVPALTLHLRDAEPDVRLEVARALGGIGPSAAKSVRVLKGVLRDDDERVRVWAEYALFRITGDKDGYLTPLLETFADRSASTARKCAAAEVLGELGPDVSRAVPVLTDALKEQAAVGIAAAGALGRMGAAARPAVPALVGLLAAEQGRDVQEAAVAALGKIGAAAGEAVPALEKLAADPAAAPGLTAAAREAVRKIQAAVKNSP